MKEQLISMAKQAMENAYAPYSGYRVGAALLATDGRIFTGCNVENAAYSPTMCAERVAFGKAVSQGCREFAALAVCGGKDGEINQKCTPCGVCRQVISEFCKGDFPIYITDGTTIEVRTLAQLLPEGFCL